MEETGICRIVLCKFFELFLSPDVKTRNRIDNVCFLQSIEVAGDGYMVDFFSFALGTQISADAAWRDEVSGIGDYVFYDAFQKVRVTDFVSG